MNANFDQIIDRRASNCSKWEKFGPDVLPFWIADMDFAAPDFVLQALTQRMEHPIIGYTDRPDSLNEALQNWLMHHFGWRVPDEWIVWLPGVVPALNLAAQTLDPDAGVLIPTPVYHPFLDIAKNAGLEEVRAPMHAKSGRWEMDFDLLTAAKTQRSKMMMICNPQNPTGRCYSAAELSGLANFIDREDLLLVSDEIHCNIILDQQCQHIPIAAAHPEIANRTITLFAATKIYNIPGISSAAAIIPDARLRGRCLAARRGLMPSIGPLGFTASEAAFNDRSDWIPQLLDYLRGNLKLIEAAVGDRLSPLEATYLAWIKVDDLGLQNTESYFAQHGLGISPGAQFGQPEFIRLNFGCPRSMLEAGLERLTAAINAAT